MDSDMAMMTNTANRLTNSGLSYISGQKKTMPEGAELD